MKLLEFNYTKPAEASHTHRVILSPDVKNPNIRGIDLSSMTEQDREVFLVRYASLFEDYRLDLEELIDEYGLGNNYRQFKRENITNLTETILKEI